MYDQRISAMTEERYVTFETAKLLNENGFEIDTGKDYWKVGEDGTMYFMCSIGAYTSDINNKSAFYRPADTYPCPTQAVAMRWLRDEYHIAVSPIPYRYPGKWDCMLVYLGEPKEKDDKYDISLLGIIRTSYEEVAEEGIRYVLKNIVAEIRKGLAVGKEG